MGWLTHANLSLITVSKGAGRATDFSHPGALFKSWRTWCEERNLTSGTETAFADALKDRGYEHERKKFGRGFKGIRLKAANEPNMQWGKGDGL
jgi:hypothetical protein